MEVLLELYDSEHILNVAAALTFLPERLFILGSRESLTPEVQRCMQELFTRRGLNVRVIPVTANMDNPGDVSEKLGSVLQKDKGAVIDVTGGRDLTLVEAGIAAQKYDVPLIYFDNKKQRFINVRHCPEADGREFTHALNIKEFFALGGASATGHSHIDPALSNEDTLNRLSGAWKFFLRMGERWQSLSRLFQSANAGMNADNTCFVSVPAADKPVLLELEKMGLLFDIKDRPGGTTSFRYRDETVKRVLSTTGAWLEMHVYKTALDSGLFDDVDMDVVIDWNGGDRMPGDPINEMDVCLMRGTVPIFVSCKTGSFSAQDINEFAGLTKRLGGMNARGVFVTSLEREAVSHGMIKRALESDLTVIDRNDIKNGRIPELLLNA